MHTSRSHILLVGCLVSVLVGSTGEGVRAAEAQGSWKLTEVERLYVDGRSEPPIDVVHGWEPVTLKDVWSSDRRARHLEAWYRTTVHAPPGLDELALFVPRISANASFWINGHEIGNTGPFREPMQRNWNHPVYLPIPAAWWQEGDNELYVRLKVDRSRLGMLFEIELGPRDQLYSRYVRSHFAKVTASQILTALVLVGAGVVGVFYLAVGLPRTYMWFVFGSFCWAIYSVEFFVRRIAIPTEVWVMFCSSMLFAAAYFYTRALHTLLELERPWIQRIVLAVTAINVLLFVVTPSRLTMDLRLSLQILFFGWLCYVGVTLLLYGWRRRTAHRAAVVACGLVVLVLTVWDVTFAWFGITAEFAKFPYLPLVVFVTGGSIFVRRLIETVRERDTLRTSIPAAAELEQRAVVAERQRLMREIHDGVGSQLVSTLAQLEQNPAANQAIVHSLRTSLDDLRLIVHSLQGMAQQGDIVTILATIRERAEPGLNAQGIVFDWRVRPVPHVDRFGPEQALQLMRLVQEAIANVVRHAHAKRIRLACGEEPRDGRAGVFVEIEDDGVGFDEHGQRAGVGLANMRHRARQLEGELEIRSAESGTCIRLWLPMASAAAVGGEPADLVARTPP